MGPHPAAVVSLVCVVGVTAFAQAPGVRGRVEQVRVEVRVTDDRNNPVTDLQATDFEILDDGQRQDIVTFTAAAAAPRIGTLATLPATRPDGAASVDAPGRAVVIVLDDLHVAAANTPRVTGAVRTFVDTVVSPADSVAVVFTSGAAGGGQDFTSDRRLVQTALGRFRGQKLRSATVERLDDPRLNLRGRVDANADMHQADRANRARTSLEALGKIADTLVAFVDRRPMLLFVSEGPEYEVAERPASNRSDQYSINRAMRDAIETLNRVNAVVFAIDPRGVSAGNADQIQTSSIFETAGVGMRALQNENVRAFGVVQAVATNTGGFAMLWRPDMSGDFRRVVVANESYYLIGYDAPLANRGKYHAIAVRVQRKGVQVRARTGYVLPAVP